MLSAEAVDRRQRPGLNENYIFKLLIFLQDIFRYSLGNLLSVVWLANIFVPALGNAQAKIMRNEHRDNENFCDTRSLHDFFREPQPG